MAFAAGKYALQRVMFCVIMTGDLYVDRVTSLYAAQVRITDLYKYRWVGSAFVRHELNSNAFCLLPAGDTRFMHVV